MAAPRHGDRHQTRLPDRIVFTYQGDGDLASIGTGEIIHAAARGENITVIFINNANFWHDRRTDGSHHLAGQKTTSSPNGRDVELQGYPIRMAEMLATLDGAGYMSAAACMTDNIRRARRPSAPHLKRRCAAWASRWSNCSPPAHPTGT